MMASTTTLKLEMAEKEDIPALIQVANRSFFPDEHPAQYLRYPRFWTDDGARVKIERTLHGWDARPSCTRQLKVIDTATNRLVLQGQWLVPSSSEQELEQSMIVPKMQGSYWVSEQERSYAQWIWDRYNRLRNAARKAANGQLFCITSLAVDPDYQSKGAGGLFVRWGTEQADALGVECSVEAGMRSESFYARHGFVKREHVTFTPPDEWKDRGVQEYVWMIRPPIRKTMVS